MMSIRNFHIGLRLAHYYMLVFLIISLHSTSTSAQIAENYNENNSTQVYPLNVGEKAPDILLTNVFNYSNSSARLSDFGHKLIILDFWATWCSSCIEAFPKMLELQKQFGTEIQIILINTFMGDDPKTVSDYFAKRKLRTGQGVELPYSLQQQNLDKYFPHKFVPHYVWLDKNRNVIAATSQTEVSEDNIRSILKGKQVLLHTKKDDLVYDNRKPLFVDNNGGTGNDFLFRSIITGYKEGLGNIIGVSNENDNKTSRLSLINCPLISMYRVAFPEMNKPGNQVIIEVAASYKSKFIFSDSIIYENMFCYELVMPTTTKSQMFKHLQEDLVRFFHITVKKEKRVMNCLVMTTNKNIQNLYTKGGSSEAKIEKYDLQKYIQNKPISVFNDILNSFFDIPILDESGLTVNLDLQFPANFYALDKKGITEFLKKNGINLIHTNREFDVAVLTDQLE